VNILYRTGGCELTVSPLNAPTSGLLVLDKPVGMTSRQAVDCVKKPLRPAKVGHAGTLDPLADGVLVICVGAATRMIDYLHRLPKRYVATFQFGVTSPTLDLESDLIELPEAARIEREDVLAVLPKFTGTIEQRPPAFSALWVQGQRAYDLARRGESVELAARPVTIHALELVSFEYPHAVFDISCSTGTYIRSLGRDIAEALGSSAVMTALTRTAIGPFRKEEAIAPREATKASILERLRSAAEAVAEMPRYVADEAERDLIAHGRILQIASFDAASEVAAIDAGGALLAILNRTPEGWRPRPNLVGVH
jgi:tRNA pseudouridine55 synthase